MRNPVVRVVVGLSIASAFLAGPWVEPAAAVCDPDHVNCPYRRGVDATAQCIVDGAAAGWVYTVECEEHMERVDSESEGGAGPAKAAVGGVRAQGDTRVRMGTGDTGNVTVTVRRTTNSSAPMPFEFFFNNATPYVYFIGPRRLNGTLAPGSDVPVVLRTQFIVRSTAEGQSVTLQFGYHDQPGGSGGDTNYITFDVEPPPRTTAGPALLGWLVAVAAAVWVVRHRRAT